MKSHRLAAHAKRIGRTSKTAVGIEREPTREPQRAYERIRKMILDNDLQPGTYVLQEDLGALLGVSRTPIREALIRLENEGLIEIKPRHGMRVAPVSLEAMREIYQVLTALEGEAVRLAAERGLPPQQLSRLDDAVADMDKALHRDDLENWSKADSRFHHLLVEFSGNSRLMGMVQTVIDQSYRVRRLTLKLRPRPLSSNVDHRAVVQAIRARKPSVAQRIHQQHHRKSGQLLLEILKALDVRAL